jgi:hypothetical protein
MKKIFLLTLLSVFFLSAFSQYSGETEVLSRVTITKSIDPLEYEGGEIQYGFWFLFYKYVYSEPCGDGVCVYCSGWGRKCCFPKIKIKKPVRGVDTEVMEQTCENLMEESDQQIVNGELSGALSRKIAFNDPLNNGKISYLIFQIKWEHDPKYPYNGKAEITVSKTNNLGLQ